MHGFHAIYHSGQGCGTGPLVAACVCVRARAWGCRAPCHPPQQARTHQVLRTMRARGPNQVRGTLARLLPRRWGFTALRECPRLLLDRVYLLQPSVASSDFRHDLRSGEIAPWSCVLSFSLHSWPVCRSRHQS